MDVQLSTINLGVGVAALGHDDHLARTLESVDAVLAEAHVTPVARILVAADASTKTEQIAIQAGWTLKRISAAQPKTLAAAREAARRGAGGAVTLLVDGDVALAAGWLATAVQRIAEDERIAGIGGVVDEAHWAKGALLGSRHDVNGIGTAGSAKPVRDVGLWRRSSVDTVGGFDPWIAFDDEAELAGRLRAAGSTVWNLPLTAGTRHGIARDSFADFRRFVGTPELSGPGTVLRRARGTMAFPRLFMRYQVPLLLLAWVLAGAAAMIAGGRWGLGTVWLWATAGLLALFSVVRQSLPRAFWRGMHRIAESVSVVRALVPVGGRRLGPAPRPLPPPKPANAAEGEEIEPARAVAGDTSFRGAPRDPDDPPPLVAILL